MAVAVNMPYKREEKDPLDTIAKGLQIASTVYGIKDASAKADQLAQQTKMQNALTEKQLAELDRRDKGILTAGELLAQSGKYSPAQPGDTGALKFRVQGDGGVSDVWLKPPKNEETAGLAGLIKQQQAILQGQQIAQNSQKANEIEGPKAQAATFGRRLEQANNIFENLGKAGYDRSSNLSSLEANLPDAIQGGTSKQQGQAERNFVNALLRRESGAAISQSEFKSAEQQYFDRNGDTPEVKAQKAQNRLQAIAGLQAEAGRAWDKIPLVQTPAAIRPEDRGINILAPPQARASDLPKQGHKEDGYQFLGGDPGDKKNWKKVK